MVDPRNKPIWRGRQIADPAVGAEISITPTTSAGWWIQSLNFLLTTSAVVATRVPTMLASNGTDNWLRTVAANGQVASVARRYVAYMGASRGSEGGDFISVDWPVNGVFLPQGHTLSTVTANRDAGDQYSAVHFAVWEFPTGPRLHMWPFVPVLEEESS